MPMASSSRYSRRDFLSVLAAGIAAAAAPGRATRAAAREDNRWRLLFTSAGRTGIVDPDGAELEYLEFDVPGQATWQPGPILPDGRLILLSMEPRRDGPGRPFDQYYTQTPTHLWLYDPATRQLDELCTRDRRAPFVTPALWIGGDRLLVQVVAQGVGQIWSLNFDGSDQQKFTRADEGFPYGLSLSPAGDRVAFHTAGPAPHAYRIWTSALDGSDRRLIAGDPEHLFFGPQWSPDGAWLSFLDCRHQADPGHDWADLVVARADGSELRHLTEGQALWFGVTYGPRARHGGGSDIPAWTHDGRLLAARRLPGSQVAWQFQPQRPDVDHFNRDFHPESARGGTQLTLFTRGADDGWTPQSLTAEVEGQWAFRGTPSPQGLGIAYCQAATGASPSLWLLTTAGDEPRLITQGLDQQGVDHPRWLPPRRT